MSKVSYQSLRMIFFLLLYYKTTILCTCSFAPISYLWLCTVAQMKKEKKKYIYIYIYISFTLVRLFKYFLFLLLSHFFLLLLPPHCLHFFRCKLHFLHLPPTQALMACLNEGGRRGSRVELAKNRLILN